MQTNYVEYKDETDLYRKFVLQFDNRSINVYVWNSINGLRRNTHFKISNYYGAYVAYPYRKKSGLFGEIHLIRKRITIGYVSHEVQHLLYDWLMQQPQTAQTNERLATLAGEIMSKIWSKLR